MSARDQDRRPAGPEPVWWIIALLAGLVAASAVQASLDRGDGAGWVLVALGILLVAPLAHDRLREPEDR